jgi:tetratricopeptide (TPR) repeat protein
MNDLKRKLVILIICLAGCLRVYSNDAPLMMVGTTATPVLSNDIIMIREKIEVQLGIYESMVKCTFVFKNTGDKKNILMGFPEKGTYLGGSIMNNFNTIIKGKNIPFQRVKGNEPWKNWNVWTVSFEEGEELTVTNTYELGGRIAAVKGIFGYIFETGSGWKDSISNSEIVVTLSDLPIEQVCEISPGYQFMNDSTLYWKFENYEPDSSHNVYIRYLLEPYRLGNIKHEIWQEEHNGVTIDFDRNLFDSVVFFQGEGRYQEAIELISNFQKRTKLDKNSILFIYANYYKAACYQKTGEYREAIRCYGLTNLKSPDFNTFLEMARIYDYNLENKEKAIEYYEKAQIPFHLEDYKEILKEEELFYSPEIIESFVIPYLKNEGLNLFCNYRISHLKTEK